jgi:hypothetical protein
MMMTERTAKLIADKLETMDTANGEHDARVALKLTASQALEALALVKAPSAPAAYVRAYTEVMFRNYKENA